MDILKLQPRYLSSKNIKRISKSRELRQVYYRRHKKILMRGGSMGVDKPIRFPAFIGPPPPGHDPPTRKDLVKVDPADVEERAGDNYYIQDNNGVLVSVNKRSFKDNRGHDIFTAESLPVGEGRQIYKFKIIKKQVYKRTVEVDIHLKEYFPDNFLISPIQIQTNVRISGQDNATTTIDITKSNVILNHTLLISHYKPID